MLCFKILISPAPQKLLELGFASGNVEGQSLEAHANQFFARIPIQFFSPRISFQDQFVLRAENHDSIVGPFENLLINFSREQSRWGRGVRSRAHTLGTEFPVDYATNMEDFMDK